MRTRRLAAAALAGLLSLVLAPAVAAKTSTPPPTPVPPNASPSPFPSVLRTPEPSAQEPLVGAPVAALADLDTGQLLWAKSAGIHRPIASVTKIMTAVLVLERTAPDDVVTVSEHAAPDGPTTGVSNLGLEPGERVSVTDLLYALMLQSANDAAVALAEHVGGNVEGFVHDMNAKAERLGLRDTEFFSPNGLDDRGHSSARDLARLTSVAYHEPGFARIVATKFHDIPAPEGKPRSLQNRNVLLWLYPGAIGVKTGYTTAARFCIVAAAEREGLRLGAVVLGSSGEPFSDAAEMLNFGFAAFERRRFVEPGEAFGRLDVQGGSVPVAAAEGLTALVPSAAVDDVVEVPRADPGALFPPAEGERVGTLTVRARELVLGRVPLVASLVPPPPDPPAGSVISRAVSSIFGGLLSAFRALLG